MHKGISHLPRRERNTSKLVQLLEYLSPFHGCGKGFCIWRCISVMEVKKFAKREDFRTKETNSR